MADGILTRTIADNAAESSALNLVAQYDTINIAFALLTGTWVAAEVALQASVDGTTWGLLETVTPIAAISTGVWYHFNDVPVFPYLRFWSNNGAIPPVSVNQTNGPLTLTVIVS
jgi:hypothetical protein